MYRHSKVMFQLQKQSINRIQNKCNILKTKIQISQNHYILFQESKNQLGACFFNSKRAVLKCNLLDLVIKSSYLSILKGLHCSSSCNSFKTLTSWGVGERGRESTKTTLWNPEKLKCYYLDLDRLWKRNNSNISCMSNCILSTVKIQETQQAQMPG